MTKLANSDDSKKPSGSSQSGQESRSHEEIAPELSKFQVRQLATVARTDRYGIGIQEQLEDYYQTEVHHGRNYPNLDELVEYGLVEKTERDRRTNNYSATELGRRVLQYELAWLETQMAQGESR